MYICEVKISNHRGGFRGAQNGNKKSTPGSEARLTAGVVFFFFLELFLVAGKSFLQAFFVRIEQVGIIGGPDVAHIVHTVTGSGPQKCSSACRSSLLHRTCMWRMESAGMEVSGG